MINTRYNKAQFDATLKSPLAVPDKVKASYQNVKPMIRLPSSDSYVTKIRSSLSSANVINNEVWAVRDASANRVFLHTWLDAGTFNKLSESSGEKILSNWHDGLNIEAALDAVISEESSQGLGA